MVLKSIFEPMQSEYELQSVNAPTVSHDAIAISHDQNKRWWCISTNGVTVIIT